MSRSRLHFRWCRTRAKVKVHARHEQRGLGVYKCGRRSCAGLTTLQTVFTGLACTRAQRGFESACRRLRAEGPLIETPTRTRLSVEPQMADQGLGWPCTLVTVPIFLAFHFCGYASVDALSVKLREKPRALTTVATHAHVHSRHTYVLW